MYSDFGAFSPVMDFCAPPSYEAPSSHTRNDFVFIDDPFMEALQMPAPISGAAICIRAGMDAAAAAAGQAFTLELVEKHGELYDPRMDPKTEVYRELNGEDLDPDYDPRLDPSTDEYKELNGEDCEPGYDPRLDPESEDYME